MQIAARNAFTAGGGGGGWVNPYVTDGLIAMWDGEWNAGGGVHDAAAATWLDLIGGGTVTLPGGTVWNDNCLTWTETGARGLTLPTSTLSVSGLEMVFSIHQFKTNNFGAVFGGDSNAGVSGPVGTVRSIGQDLRPNNDYSANVVTSVDAVVSFSMVCDGSTLRPYYNGSALPTLSYTPASGNILVNDLGGYTGRSMLMSAMSLRAYSRVLIPAEIAANYAVDVARFNLPA